VQLLAVPWQELLSCAPYLCRTGQLPGGWKLGSCMQARSAHGVGFGGKEADVELGMDKAAQLKRLSLGSPHMCCVGQVCQSATAAGSICMAVMCGVATQQHT
jgi:hypothetical protein